MKAKLIAFFILILSSNVLALTFRKDTKTDTSKQATTAANTTVTAETSSTKTENSTSANEGKSENAASGKNSKLTGIPQVDYIYDPNLPRELRGYNLSNYPFFSTVPPEEDIHFKCDGLHDGFYSSIEHKCQVYHHCVYGIRHDFLCANFTAFDQKTFICHFVSDVDCEGSKKYWNRNDALYMPTTTTSTTTTTTEPPPTPARRRPQRPSRPLRRPLKRRPIDDDYYYDEEYEDEYYEAPVNRRRIPSRMRPKKPVLDYEDDYDRERIRETDNTRRHPNNRNRFRDEVDELEEDYDNIRTHSKTGDRRKAGGRTPAGAAGRQSNDERRSFPDDVPLRKDKTRVVAEDAESEADDTAYISRRYSGRRRANEKRLNNDNANVSDQEVEDDKEDKPHTSPKPPEEFITPKAAGQSVYARPRVPPRIPRPVPVNEKNKFQYPVQKSATTAIPSAKTQPEPEDLQEEYTDEDDYSSVAARAPQVPLRRRRIQDSVDTLEERTTGRKRYRTETRAKPQRNRNQLRKPLPTEKKVPPAALAYDDYDSVDEEIVERAPVERVTAARRPSTYLSSRRSSQATQAPVKEEELTDDDEYYLNVGKNKKKPKLNAGIRDNRKKPAEVAIKSARRPATVDTDVIDDVNVNDDDDGYVPDDDQAVNPDALDELDDEEPIHIAENKNRQRTRQKQQKDSIAEEPIQIEDERNQHDDTEPEIVGKSAPRTVTPVRLVKRPFLPSRGGSPYLPRGLQAVGMAPKPFNKHSNTNENRYQTRDSVDIDVGPTISSIRMLEHGALVLRHSDMSNINGHLTTLAPNAKQHQQQQHRNEFLQKAQTVEETEDVENIYDDDNDNDNINVNDEHDDVEHNNDSIKFLQKQNQQQQQQNYQQQQQLESTKELENMKETNPQATLDMLYENDYDVTINDALNPTLKPLSSLLQHQHQHPHHHHPQHSQHKYFATTSSASSASSYPSTSLKNNNNSSSNPINIINKIKYPISSSTSTSTSSSSSSTTTTSSSSSLSSASNSGGAGTSTAYNHIKNQQSFQPKIQQTYYGQQQQQQQKQQPQPQEQQTKLYNNNNNKNYNYKSDSHFSSTDLRRRAIIQATSTAATPSTAKTSAIGAKRFNNNYNHNNNNARHLIMPIQYEDDVEVDEVELADEEEEGEFDY